jgi:hypothetical protein
MFPIMPQMTFVAKTYAIFSNFSASAPQTGHLSVIGPSWVYPQIGQT